MKRYLALASWLAAFPVFSDSAGHGVTPAYEVRPIGWVRKAEGMTRIEIAAFPDTPVLDIKP
jgi:hypothetical protein